MPPLTIDELGEALALSVPAKSPGADELPVEVYKRYAGVLLPRLRFFFFLEALETAYLPPSMIEAVIVLILKPDKDSLSPVSYRPISLLTTDVKLLV